VTGMDMEVFDKKALARYLKVGIKTIDWLVYTRKIPFFKIGKEVRFFESQIVQWLTSR